MIIIKEELLSILVEQYPGWWETPEKFLSFIMLMDELTEADGAEHGTEQSPRLEFAGELAELLIREMGVDISPYENFSDLRKSCLLPDNQMEILHRISRKMQEDDRIFDLAEETGVMPSKETMVSELTHDFLAWTVIERLRPFVDFR